MFVNHEKSETIIERMHLIISALVECLKFRLNEYHALLSTESNKSDLKQ